MRCSHLSWSLKRSRNYNLLGNKNKNKKNQWEVRELFKQKGDSFEVEKELVWCEISPLSVDDKIIAYSRGNFLENFL